MNAMGLKQIQIDLTDRSDSNELSLYEEREKRKENVLLICDDDMFVRKTLVKLVSSYGSVHEVDSGSKVCAAYLECNPDIILLDIHMPEKNGLSIVNEIIDMDTDAFIIMISADSSKENVLEAISCGSVGFLSKPVKANKLNEFRSQCITLR